MMPSGSPGRIDSGTTLGPRNSLGGLWPALQHWMRPGRTSITTAKAVTNRDDSFPSHRRALAAANAREMPGSDLTQSLISVMERIMNSAAGTPLSETSATRRQIRDSSTEKTS